MKKYILVLALFFGLTSLAHAEHPTGSTATEHPASAASTEHPSSAPVSDSAAKEEAPSAVPAAAPVAAPAEAAAPEVDAAENLEFISGEVSAIDEAAKTVTIKLYGETENTPGDKSITVTVEDTTDITDGEKDRALKSLTSGTEVDVEYDPASSKATYIFVY